MKIKKLHDWNLTYQQARDLQVKLAKRVKFTPIKKPIKLIAGLDCAFSKDGGSEIINCAIVVLTFPELQVIETTKVSEKLTFPYIPGLLSFREAPVCLLAIEKLKSEPDIFMVDGQGIAHQRRFGLASHIGLFAGKPTIGCAKSRLIGTFDPVDNEKGSFSWLMDGGQIIGAVVRTRQSVKPLFVSVGHKCLLEQAIQITVRCATKYRLAEPTRLADKLSKNIDNL
jgi:deoxyribonuclease V